MSDLADKYLAAGRLLLPMGEEDSRKTYTMPDPDGLCDAYGRLYGVVFHRDAPVAPTVEVSRSDLIKVLSLASGYETLTTYELGQEHCVEKLRDIWRSRRARQAWRLTYAHVDRGDRALDARLREVLDE
jgi:hypothetical protein